MPPKKAPTGAAVAANIARIRQARNLSYAELSRQLHACGWPIPTLGLRKIESGERRVDVDDLAALAVTLESSPLELMLPSFGHPTDLVEATGLANPIPAAELIEWLSRSALDQLRHEQLGDRTIVEAIQVLADAAGVQLDARGGGKAGFKFEGPGDGDD